MAPTWILILTLQTGYGLATTAVNGFWDKASCEKAGATWQKQQGMYMSNARYVCVSEAGSDK